MSYSLLGISFEKDGIEPTYRQRVVTTLFNLIATIVVLAIFMRFVDKKPFNDLGLSIRGRTKEIVLGLLIGVVVMTFAYYILNVLDVIQFKNSAFNLVDFLFVFLVFTFVSLAEEMLFRGYILRNFMSSFNKYFALIFSSILFSLMHGFNDNFTWISFINIFLAGVLLGTGFIFTKNLWFPIALHFSWNFFQSIMGFNVSGHDAYSVVDFDIREHNLLNGGNFGFEGSIFAIVFQVLLIILIFWYFKVNRKLSVIDSD